MRFARWELRTVFDARADSNAVPQRIPLALLHAVARDRGRRSMASDLLRHTPVRIFKANDIVFAEVRTRLHLD